MLDKIQALIKAKGLTQKEVEAQLGFAENRISKWINGAGEPKAHQVWLLARALGVSAEYLLNDSIDDPTNDTGLTEDERYILKTVRSIGLTADEFARKVYGIEMGKGEPPKKEAPKKVPELVIKQRSKASKSKPGSESA